MEQLHRKLTHDLDKITLLRRIFTQRAATRDGICLGQLPALRYISVHPGCTQKDVADFLHVSPPSVAVMVKRMVRDGMVKKAADEADMRQNRLTITPNGQELVEQSRKIFEQSDKQVYAGFNEEELQLLASFLSRLIDNLASNEVRNTSNFALMEMVKSMETDGHDQSKKKEE